VEKIIYLGWTGGADISGDALRDQLVAESAPRLISHGVHGLGINVHDTAAAEAPSPAPTPDGEAAHVAEVSVWLDCYERGSVLEESLPADLAWSGYLVVESLYDDYGTTAHAPPRDWPDGDRSPGVLTVALIHRPEGLDPGEWIRRWHGTQSPVSARLQPRTRYVRNQVVRSLTAEAPEVDGIVEEGWPSAGHVADPLLFFNAGTAEELDAHVGEMMASVSSCLDLSRLRSTTMSEYLMKSVP
jgi:hypothetical protein